MLIELLLVSHDDMNTMQLVVADGDGDDGSCCVYCRSQCLFTTNIYARFNTPKIISFSCQWQQREKTSMKIEREIEPPFIQLLVVVAVVQKRGR